MKIILAAAISRFPITPGSVWNRIHRLTGLQRLGHEVVFVEEIAREKCIDQHGRRAVYPDSIHPHLFTQTMNECGLQGRSCQIYNHGEATCGMDLAALRAWAQQTDLLLNMSGHLTTEPILSDCRRRIYLDEDPVYTQLWHTEYGCDLNFSRHEVFFSVGQNIGTAATTVPDCGRRWHHFLPPVVLELWPATEAPADGRFTTVASLEAYGALQYRGEWFRSKAGEFQRFAEVPRRAQQPMEVALRRADAGSPTAEMLRQNQWVVSDAGALCSLSDYQRFLYGSRAEIGIAQHAYVKARSGWFSDRSAHYLAAGRPVLAESTGLEDQLPTGEGLLTFSDLTEAVAGVEAINTHYPAHCRAARDWAERHLDYRKVLPPMLELSRDSCS